jgi:hypothetical protein
VTGEHTCQHAHSRTAIAAIKLLIRGRESANPSANNANVVSVSLNSDAELREAGKC